MKKYWLIGGGLASLAGVAFIAARLAYAGVTCTLPFNLQNNTVADANQVMANYNALVTCLTQAAHAGSNSDITALNALATPIPPSSGGTNVWLGSNSVGTNTLTTTTTPAGFALTAGYRVGFVVGATNTASATINVSATGPKNIFRRTTQGVVQMAGGELVANNYVEIVYDGTQFQLLGQTIDNIGEIRDWAGSAGASPPNGYLFADGSCYSRTGVYASLFAIISTTYTTSCAGTEFQLPDLRGRVTAGKDDQGGGAANRITNAASGCTGTTLGGAGCGAQTTTVAHTNLPQLPITDPGHIHLLADGANPLTGGAGAGSVSAAGASFPATAIAAHTTGITVNATSTNIPLPVLNPLQIVYKIIKY